ncbi:hypothetical protein C8Q78DRAFT_1003772 [Trametes maxima]|nr:hypothetical protein C8Q78DRAFT_1003772 [Trametes maxima]
MSSPAQSSGKPVTPPPAYSEHPQMYTQPTSPNQSVSASPHTPVGRPLPFPVHAGYGPTPIAQQTQLLPYYDPRSQYAFEEATTRARWRFTKAVLWAMFTLGLALGFMSVAAEWEFQALDVRRIAVETGLYQR